MQALPHTEPFIWGVSTSGYQSEGGYNNEGEPRNNWSRWEADGTVIRSGRAVDFWNSYETDFALARSIGLTGFRLGIEWSRLQPSLSDRSTRQTPDRDPLALAHYVKMIHSCRDHGLEPLITLHHFVHPAWLGRDPWLHESTIELFAGHALWSITEINRQLMYNGSPPLRQIITINEPNMLVFNQYLLGIFPGSLRHRGLENAQRAFLNLIRSHVRIHSYLHDMYERENLGSLSVTFNNFCNDIYWADRVWLDLLTLRDRSVSSHETRSHLQDRARTFNKAFHESRLPFQRNISFYAGSTLRRILDFTAPRYFQTDFLQPLLDEMNRSDRDRHMDTVAFDYYDPFCAHAFRRPVWCDHDFQTHSWHSFMMQAVTSKWWDWRVLPEGLAFYLRSYARDYPGYPILIAENGIAHRCDRDNRPIGRSDRVTRSEYLRLHVAEVLKARREGIPLTGYYHWSLTDNYEWGSYQPRFGLYAIEFGRSLERQRMLPDGDTPSDTYRRLIGSTSMSTITGH